MLQETIRSAICADGRSQSQIAHAAGITEASLSRFLSDQNLRGDTLDRLADALGVVVVARSDYEDMKNKMDSLQPAVERLIEAMGTLIEATRRR